MTDIVERLRKLGGDGSTGYGMPIASEAADRIIELEHELAGHRKALNAAKQIIAGQENRILRMTEHNLECVEAVTSLQSEREANALLTSELAAAQAREKVLIKIIEDTKDEVWMCLSHEHATRFSAALRLPPADDTALRAALKAERERCTSVCLDIVDGQQYANAIRALD